MHVVPTRPVAVALHPPPDPVESSFSDGGRPPSTLRRIGLVAGRQRGIIARDQLLRLGVHPRAVGRLVERGWLIPLHAGVYAVGHRPRTFGTLRWGAVLACGPGAKASFGMAAAAHALLAPSHRLHVTTPSKRSRPGIATHTADTATVWIDGLPCTPVARTLVDLAGCVPDGVLESACRQAQVRGVLDVEAIGAVLLACPRPRGVRRLRAILADPVALAPTRSRAERVALRALLDDGWPWPDVGEDVLGETLDFSWPGLRRALEVDGPTHDTPIQAARDAARDARLAAAGWRIDRVRDTDVANTPAVMRRVVDVGRPPSTIDDSTRGRREGSGA